MLEAVGWLARMSSFRGRPTRRWSGSVSQAIVRAEIVPATAARRPARPDRGRDRRRRPQSGALNRKPLPRARDLLGTLRVTVFAPDDLRLVKAGPAERRAELDDLLVVLSPRYDAVQADYERVLKHRNAWLRTWSWADDPATLDVWDEQLVRAGAELVRGRLKLLDRLAAPLARPTATWPACRRRGRGLRGAWAGRRFWTRPGWTTWPRSWLRRWPGPARPTWSAG